MSKFDATVGVLVVVDVAAEEGRRVGDRGEREGRQRRGRGKRCELVLVGSRERVVDGAIFVEDRGHRLSCPAESAGDRQNKDAQSIIKSSFISRLFRLAPRASRSTYEMLAILGIHSNLQTVSVPVPTCALLP
jgi:hypothetical protein